MLIVGAIASEDWASGKCFLGKTVPQGVDVHPFVTHWTDAVKSGIYTLSKPTNTTFRSLSKPNETTAEPKEVVSWLWSSFFLLQIKCRYDIDAPGALVMRRPSSEHQKLHNKAKLQVVDVVVDPHLSCMLRPHQVRDDCGAHSTHQPARGCNLSL